MSCKNMSQSLKKILKESRLSLTDSRIELLKVLNGAVVPLSEKEIENKMGIDCNRTTVYRNLSTMSKKGILQRVMSGDAVKYKLKNNRAHDLRKDHIHFECIRCNRVYCLEELTVEDYKLPKGFQKKENQFLVIGICNNCNIIE